MPKDASFVTHTLSNLLLFMDNDRHVGAFSWHQSLDQAVVNILVPPETIFDDLDVVIDPPHVLAGIRGQMPILKGKVYDGITKESHWNFEPLDNPRRRTTSTASTISTQSSYAYVSDPEISSSFAASLDSAPASDNDDSDYASPERSHAVSRDEHLHCMTNTVPAFPQRATGSYPASPQMQSMDSSLSSLDSLRPERPEKLLTIVLAKEKATYWPRLIEAPLPEKYSPTPSGPFTFDNNVERKYNVDPTSLGLIGEEYLKLRNDREEAFEYFVRSWHYLHSPFSALRLTTFLPVTTVLPANLHPSPRASPSPLPRRGTVEYYLLCLGGTAALAQLFLECGLAHLDGIATKLISSNYSPLNSIRRSEPPILAQRIESSTQIWKRDRANARTYFERARKLAPGLDGSIPYLPEETDLRGVDQPGRPGRVKRSPRSDSRTRARTSTTPSSERPELELQMPSMYVEEGKTLRPEDAEKARPESTVRMRRRRQQASEALLEQNREAEEDSTWYLYLPGLVGAGTALLVVSVVGALSFQSWRKNNN